jgi:NAD-dependent SIR2 family protein deacetylase
MSSLENKLKESEKIVFLTGAEISQESGINTFRWNQLSVKMLKTYDIF